MKMRNSFIVLSMAIGATLSMPASGQVSFGVSLPGVSIGVNVPVYPELVPVPGYPVYYAPNIDSNYFFYDGMYWLFQGDNWYMSSWYNGPWVLVAPDAVPLFVLRVPVRYYRRPPVYFNAWYGNAPPRWGEHWGRGWEDHHRGWDRWNRAAVPAPAPLPVYQRQYTGNRYPQPEQQISLEKQNYRYQPRDTVVRQHYQAQAAQAPSAPSASLSPQVATPSPRGQPQQMNRGEVQHPSTAPAPAQQAATPPPQRQPAQTSRGETQRPAPVPPPQATAPPSHEPPRAVTNNAQARHPAGGPPPSQQAVAPAPHPQPQPQPPQARGGEMRTAAAPPAPQHAAAPPHEAPAPRAGGEPQQRGPQGNGQPQARQNQEKDGERNGQGGGK